MQIIICGKHMQIETMYVHPHPAHTHKITTYLKAFWPLVHHHVIHADCRPTRCKSSTCPEKRDKRTYKQYAQTQRKTQLIKTERQTDIFKRNKYFWDVIKVWTQKWNPPQGAEHPHFYCPLLINIANNHGKHDSLHISVALVSVVINHDY